nr:MAG: RNA-dependent RNA polymerase [Sichuan sediment birna-like virus 2]
MEHETTDDKHVRSRGENFKYEPAFDKTNSSTTYYNEGGSGLSLEDVVKMSKREKTVLREKLANKTSFHFPMKLPHNYFTKNDVDIHSKIKQLFCPTFKVNEKGLTLTDRLDDQEEATVTKYFALDTDINSVLTNPGVVAMVQQHIDVLDAMDDESSDAEKFKMETLTTFSCGRILMNAEHLRRNVSAYRPSYRIINPWFLVFNASQHVFDLSMPAEIKTVCLQSILFFATRYSLTNGCYTGQIARLEDTWRVCREVDLRVPTVVRSAYVDTGAILDNQWGLVHMEQMSREDIRDMLLTDSWQDRLMRINITADAGEGWPSLTKRKQTILSDVCYANELVAVLDKMQQHVVDAEDTEEAMLLVDTYLTGMLDERQNLMRIKPKLFVYPKDKVLKKTRNICVYTSAYQVLIGKAMTHLMSQPQNHIPLRINENTGRRTHSLMGFVPLHRNFDKLFDYLHENALDNENPHKPWSYCFYSDNIFVYNGEKRVFFSLDVEKMEATSSREESAMIMDYVLNSIGIDHSLQIKVYQRYLQYMGSDFCHFAPGVLSDMIVAAPGIGSGAQVTFIINHGRMALNVDTIMEFIVKNPDMLANTEHGGKLTPLFNTRVSFNLEMTTNTNTTHHATDAKFSNPSIRYITLREKDEHFGTIETFGPIIDTDLLGYSCTPVKASTGEVVLVPCLDYERIMKSITFRKEHGALKNHQQADLMINIVNLLTLQMLYGIGGFAYETVHYIIRNAALSLKNQIDNSLKAQIDPKDALPMMEQMAEILTREAAEYLMLDMEEGTVMTDSPSSQAAMGMARGVVGLVASILNNNYEWSTCFSRKNVLSKYHIE